MGAFLQVVNLPAGAWDLSSFLKNSATTLHTWFSLAILILGVTAVAYAAWQIVSGLMSHGKKQTNWAVAIILLIVGGALSASGGFDFVQKIASGGKQTISDLGNGKSGMIFLLQSFRSWF